MGMQKPESAQSPGSSRHWRKLRYVNGAGLAHNDHMDFSLAIREDAYLPPCCPRQDSQLPGLFR